MSSVALPQPARLTVARQLTVARLFALGVLLALARASAPLPAEASEGPEEPEPVLVELFTSEGCSSCPPADHLLRQLVEQQPVPGAEILGLSFHVDYWNHLGWRDPFSSSRWSARQREYAELLEEPTVYTPQIIVDGGHSLVGSDGDRVVAAIREAARQPRRRLDIELAEPGTRAAEGILELQVSSPSATSWPTAGRLYVAVVEDGLSSSVRRGENAGRELVHTHVVRALYSERTPRGAWSIAVRLRTAPEWRREELSAIAWLQDGRGTIEALGRWQNRSEVGARRP